MQQPRSDRLQGRDYPYNRQPRRVSQDSSFGSAVTHTANSTQGEEAGVPDPTLVQPTNNTEADNGEEAAPADKKRCKPSDFPRREETHLNLCIDDFKVFFPIAKLFPSPADSLQWALEAFNRANDHYEATIPDFIRLPFALDYECVVSPGIPTRLNLLTVVVYRSPDGFPQFAVILGIVAAPL